MTSNMKESHRQHFRYASIVGAALILTFSRADAQEPEPDLSKAVEEAQSAWLAHKVDVLVSSSDTVRLHIPGVVPSASLRPGQAARLLERYLKTASERTFELRDVRELAPDHAYAEIERVYVVKGTSEEREETVFLGFRLVHGKWSLREVRVTP